VLTVAYPTGACLEASGGLVYPAATAVVIGSWSRYGTAKLPCPAIAQVTTSKVRLAAPLGTRPVLDARSGEPVLINPRV
jgi:hypothetical protein